MLAARRNINYCAICIVYTSFTNLADGLIIQQGGWHAARGLETHVLNFTGSRRENGGLKYSRTVNLKKWMDRKSVLAASVLEADQFQNRSHRNLLFYTDSCNMYCVGSKRLLLHHPFSDSNFNLSGKNTFWCYPRYCRDARGAVLFPAGIFFPHLFLFYPHSTFLYPSYHSSRSSFILMQCHHLFISFCLYSNFLSLSEPLLPPPFSFFSLLPNVSLTQSPLVSEFFKLTELTSFSYKLTYAYLHVYSSMKMQTITVVPIQLIHALQNSMFRTEQPWPS